METSTLQVLPTLRSPDRNDFYLNVPDFAVRSLMTEASLTIRNPNRNSPVSRLRNLFQSLPFLGAVLFIFLTTFPPLEVETEINLPIHMAQHVLITVAGILIAYPLYREGKFSRIKSTRAGILGLAIICAIIVFWHIPSFWDSAVLNPVVHVSEHFSFLLVGILIGGFVPMLPDNFKMLALVLAISAHMFYGFSLYLMTTPVYPLYSTSQQALLGIFMFAPSPVYFIGFLYITLSRESRKLAGGGAMTKSQGGRKKLGRVFVVAFSVLLIAVLGGYLIITLAAISANQQTSPNVPVVYILETPITWQYSPQNITVFIGQNNTVEWISHSLTFDTVTSASGLFSHSFSPGDSFEFTFTSPGIYDYYCIYHPWMKGSIIVK